MSQYFDMGNETLWNPSNGAARLRTAMRELDRFMAR
ncbi:DUF6086 family protein [Streptomyces sp. NPDC005962]